MENNKLNILVNNQANIDKKIYKSASLTFYSKKLGYLFCEEFRHTEKKILIHPIGGKVENYDKDIFSTAIREFIEEVELELHPIINLEKNIKTTLVDNICKKLENISYHKDLCIHKKNKYFHRYYFVLIDKINDEELKKNIIELPNYFNGNYETEINKINWYLIQAEQNEFCSNISWLTKMFIKLTRKKKYI